jgi:hypothetical protein
MCLSVKTRGLQIRGLVGGPLVLSMAEQAPSGTCRSFYGTETCQHTARMSKTVLQKTYTFLDPSQDQRIFQILEALSKDRLLTLRQKAPYALGDHPGEKTAVILQRLSLDPVDEIRGAADHAKGRLREQAAVASPYGAGVQEKRASGQSRGKTR